MEKIKITVPELIKVTCKELGIGDKEFKRRSIEGATAKQIVCMILKAEGLSLSDIGRRINVDHSTVIYHLNSPWRKEHFKNIFENVNRYFNNPVSYLKPQIHLEKIKTLKILVNNGRTEKEILDEMNIGVEEYRRLRKEAIRTTCSRKVPVYNKSTYRIEYF